MAVDLLACYWTLAGNYRFGAEDHSPWDFRDRVQAAGTAGFTGVGIKQADLRRTRARYGWGEMRRILADNGIRFVEVEALFDWWLDGERRRASDRDRADLLEAAAELGACRFKVAGDFSGEQWPRSRLHDEFQQLASEVSQAGTVAVLEPIAFSNIPDLETALAIIGDSLGRGGALMLDSWHVSRGRFPLEAIAALPAGAIGGVELDDGTLAVQVGEFEDTVNSRRFCGEGEFDLPGLISACRRAGFDGPWGVELLSEQLRAMPLAAAAQRSFESTRALFSGE